MVPVLQETFLNDHLVKKDCPLQSSCLASSSQELRQWNEENRWIHQFLHLISKVEVTCWIKLVEPKLTVVWWIIREFFFGIESWIIFWLYVISKLESQVQDWGLPKNSRFSDHNALDQRSWDCQSFDEHMTSRSIVERDDVPDFETLDAMIASALKKLLNTQIHFRKRVSVEEQRARKILPFLTRESNCFHDQRAFPYNWSLWSSTRTQICSVYAYKMTTSNISTWDGDGKPNKRSLVQESVRSGCVPQDSYPRLREPGRLGSKHTV